MNENFRNLIIYIANAAKVWKENNLKSANKVIEIQEIPLNQNNDYPQVFHTVEDNREDTNKFKSKSSKVSFDLPEADDKNFHHVDFTQLPLHNSFQNSIVDSLDNSKENGVTGDAGSFGGE